ncbi:hypothetical protein AAH450_01190 [Erwinia sp. P7711]|uniref:hypothetical protein n=1 Tax=Erwinia sp. P7711 TaxID=3141451 RepID=UPI00318F2E20
MTKLDSNEHRRKEGEVSKGLPEAAPNMQNPYEEDDMPVNPERHSENKSSHPNDDK